MLTREIANQIAADWQQANDLKTSAIQQFESMLRAALLITKTQVSIAGAGKNHWDFSGIAAAVMSTPSGAVGDGVYDAAYLRAIQSMWYSYMTWLMAPITVLVNGEPVTLSVRPMDLIMSAPTLATAPAPAEGE